MNNIFPQVRLGDVCEYYTGRIAAKLLDEKTYISTENMLSEKGGITVSSGLPTIAIIPEYKKDNILLSNIRPYFKKIWVATQNGGCSNDVLVLKAKDNYFPKFLYYVLSDDKFFDYSTATSKGTKMPRGDKVAIMQYSVPDIPYEKQRIISATLSCLDDKIELNNRLNANLEAQAQAIFKNWFVDFEPFQDGEFVDSELGKIPKGWRVGTLDECIDFSNGYAFESSKLLDKEENNCYYVFKMGHIKKGGGLNTGGTKSWVRKKDFAELSKYVLRYGDILMCMTDMKSNVALLGHTAVIYEKDKYIVNQRVGLLRINNEVGIGFPYIYILTNHSDFLEDLRKRANSGVQVNLSTTEIKKSKLIIAPTNINTDFNNLTKPLFDFIYHNELENTHLKTIRDTLLPRLVSGEIEVPIEENQK
ncbi:hypothetical protein FACS1894130_03050 [Spirochaetia bacterium]|nr:hypothetical protein FACS1894130_03050 [Spirochaetia bacterium]